MAASLYPKCCIFPEERAGIIVPFSQAGRGMGHIKTGQRMGCLSNLPGLTLNRICQFSKQLKLKSHSPVRSRAQLLFQIRQLSGGEPDRLGCGLPVNKLLIAQQLFTMVGPHINMIAKHIIMFDFQ